MVSPSICHEVMGLDAMILVFWMLSFKSAFSLSSFIVLMEELGASLAAQLVKNPPAMKESLVRFLGREDPLEKV